MICADPFASAEVPRHGCPGTIQVTSDSKPSWTDPTIESLMPKISPSRSTICKRSLYGLSLQISLDVLTMLPTWLPVSVHTSICRNTFSFSPAPWRLLLQLYAGYPSTFFPSLTICTLTVPRMPDLYIPSQKRVSTHVTAPIEIYRTKQIPSCQINLLNQAVQANSLFDQMSRIPEPGTMPRRC